MKHLTLLRHAKAVRDDGSMEDFDRPLSDAGRDAAPRMGALMTAQAIRPDLALCSPSKRTRETLALAAPDIDALFPDRLYAASSSTILSVIEAAPEDSAHLLVVGHNPGLHLLALDLVDKKQSDRAALKRLREKFPTGALAHFEFDIAHWAEIAGACAALKFLATPKDM